MTALVIAELDALLVEIGAREPRLRLLALPERHVRVRRARARAHRRRRSRPRRRCTTSRSSTRSRARAATSSRSSRSARSPGSRDRYTLLRSGGALGRGCGPLVVAREAGLAATQAVSGRIAIPGWDTTAYLLLRLAAPALGEVVELRYDEILDAVASGEVDAGLIIHESRFTYAEHGLVEVADLGAWWEAETGMPVPLAAICARADIGRRAARGGRGRDPALRRARLRASRRQPRVRARALPGAVRRGLPPAHRPLRQRVHPRPRRRRDGRDRRAARPRRRYPRVINERSLADGRRRRACRAGGYVRCTTPTASRGFPARCCELFGERERRRPAGRRPARARRRAAAGGRRAHRCARMDVRRALRRARAAARATARGGRRLEVDDAVSLDHDRARHDAAHRAAGRRARRLRVVRLRAVARPHRLPADRGIRGRAAGGLVAAGADLRAVYPQADGLGDAAGAARRRRATSCSRRTTIDTPFTQLVCAGADGARRRERARGAALAARLARAAAPSLTLLYLDDFDSSGHELGPDDPRSEAVALELLEAVEHELVDALAGTPGRARAAVRRPRPAADRSRALRLRQRALPAARAAPARAVPTAGRSRRRARRATSSCTCARARSTTPSACSRSSSGTTRGWCRRPTRGRRHLRAPDLGALPRARRRPRRAAARGRRGLVARARALRAGACAATTAGWSPTEAETWLGALVP